jgi:SNF2-related domain/Helicase conserved C-terminal domain
MKSSTFFHDASADVLIYDLDSELRDRTQQAIPNARLLNNGYVAFKRSLFNCQVARWLGLPVPFVMDGYDWPIHGHDEHGKPFVALPHQKLMANFQVLNPKCFNLSDMGTMKTMPAIWAADWLMQKLKCRTLIVCPRSIRQRVWGDALFASMTGRREWQIIAGTSKARRNLLAKPADFYVMNFDALKIGATRGKRRQWTFARLAGDILDRKDIKIVIVDEADAYCDGTTDRSHVARQLLMQRDYLWLMTGTPVRNSPVDAHGLALFVNGAGGEPRHHFFMRTMQQLSRYKWVPRRDGYEAAYQLLQPAIRIPIEQVWQGAPEMTTQQRDVALSPEQKKMLRELKNSLAVTVKNGQTIIPANAAVARNKALQILLGSIYDDSHNSHRVACESRLKELHTAILQSKSKVLVFAGLTSVIHMVEEYLTKLGVQTACIIGMTTDKYRNQIISAFQDTDELKVIVADPRTMGHGLNLFAASTVVWFGPSDSTGHYLQANKRAHRPGQKHPVTVVQLVASALERGIYAKVASNASSQQILLDWIKGEEL